MDATMMTGWWDCPDCGVEAELTVAAAEVCQVPCPDCGGGMAQRWYWDAAA